MLDRVYRAVAWQCVDQIRYIIIKAESYRVQTGLKQYYNCQNPLDVCGAVVATCIRNASVIQRMKPRERRRAQQAP
jgi:hypothetical protein